jgi:SAM-dependent methyltransferase
MVREFWESVEGRGDTSRVTGPDAEALVAIPNLEALLPKDLRGVRALDAVCGNGARAVALARRGANVSIMHEDERALNDMFQRFTMEGLHADLVVGSPDARSDLPDESFDLVTAGEELLGVEDLAKAMLNIQRVMRPGGALVLTLPHPLLQAGSSITDGRGGRNIIVKDYFGVPAGAGLPNRTLSDYINPMARAGLVIESILEPRPPDRLRKLGKENWAYFDRIPQYIMLVARKPGAGASALKLAWISRALEDGQ